MVIGNSGYPSNFVNLNSLTVEQIINLYSYAVIISDDKINKFLYKWLNNNLQGKFSYSYSTLMKMKYNVAYPNNTGVLFLFSNKSDAIKTKLIWG